MDKLEPENRQPESADKEEPSRGPSLVLMYSLIALAILVAIAVAAIIVLPFYQRR